jgi:hypothetical protein
MADNLPVLRDIHLPAPPAVWPPAPGWWLLAILALVALGFAVRLLLRRRARAARRRRLLAEFDALRPAAIDAGTTPAYLAALSAFLRRLARAVSADAAVLRGDDWIRFLDRHDDGFAAYADALNDAAWRPHAAVDVGALHALARTHLQRVLARELRHVGTSKNVEIPAAQSCAARDRARQRLIGGGESGPAPDSPTRKTDGTTVFRGDHV